jgi:hypothetical protein
MKIAQVAEVYGAAVGDIERIIRQARRRHSGRRRYPMISTTRGKRHEGGMALSHFKSSGRFVEPPTAKRRLLLSLAKNADRLERFRDRQRQNRR